MAAAMHVKRSGNIVKGPRPDNLNPINLCINGFEVRA
jgi:hypothetical protein